MDCAENTVLQVVEFVWKECMWTDYSFCCTDTGYIILEVFILYVVQIRMKAIKYEI